MSIEDGTVTLRYMEKNKKGYFWPDVNETEYSEEAIDKLKIKLTPPTSHGTSTRIWFEFDKKELKLI